MAEYSVLYRVGPRTIIMLIDGLGHATQSATCAAAHVQSRQLVVRPCRHYNSVIALNRAMAMAM